MNFHTGIYNFKLQKALFMIITYYYLSKLNKFYMNIEPDGELSFNLDNGYITTDFNSKILTPEIITELVEQFLSKYCNADEYIWDQDKVFCSSTYMQVDASDQKMLFVCYPRGSVKRSWLHIAIDVLKGVSVKDLLAKYSKQDIDDAIGRPLDPFVQEARKQMLGKINDVKQNFSSKKYLLNAEYQKHLYELEEECAQEVDKIMKKIDELLY